MITLTKNLNEAKFVTHAGNFHADDCFSAVFLDKLYGNITLIRLNEYQDDGTKLAFDIGLGKFDHHQKNFAQKRTNGIHYCSFGLLWQEFGREYLKKIGIAEIEETFQTFDYLLVNAIDAFDNGEFSITSDYNIYTISSLIELFRPPLNANADEDACFLKATEYASTIFELVLNDALNKVQNITLIKEKIPTIQDKILILDEFIPYEYALFALNLDVDFVVYPSNRGGYTAKTVPTTYKGFKSKVPFKNEWTGLRDEELAKVSNIKTARFCHNKLFLFTADTKEDALLAAKICKELTKK